MNKNIAFILFKVKPLFAIFLVLLLSSVTYSQGVTDTIGPTIDSLQKELPQVPDTVKAALQKADSIRHAFNSQADTLKNRYEESLAKIESVRNRLNLELDSLKRLDLPTGKITEKTEKITEKIDSLKGVLENTTGRFTSKMEELKGKATTGLNKLDLPPPYDGHVQELTQKINGLSLNSDFVKISGFEVPGLELPQWNGLPDIEKSIITDGKLDMPEVDTPFGELKDVSQQIQGYSKDMKNIAEGNLRDVQQLPNVIEQKAANFDGVRELQKQSGVLDGYKNELEGLKNADALKQKAVETAKKAAVDHFAGKQEQLKAAMEKMAQYKRKYSSVNSIKDLPKRPPNPLKGKPLVERLVPGLYFQYQVKGDYLLDVNPYLGYRFNKRLTAGLGWNQRIAYDKDHHTRNRRARVFGPRAYADFKLGRGFIAHLETEYMNTFVPLSLIGNPDVGDREWVWGVMTGMKKEYRIYKSLKGTVLIQYNLFGPRFKSPYVDRLNSRLGFEYMLKKSKKSGMKPDKR